MVSIARETSIDRLCTDTFSPLKRGIQMRAATICPQTVYYIIAVCKAVVVALVCQLRISITHAQYAWSVFSCKANWLIMTWNKAYMLIYTHCFTYIRICNDSQQCAVSVNMFTPLILRLVLVLALLVHGTSRPGWYYFDNYLHFTSYHTTSLHISVTFASRAITESKLCEHLLKMDCARKGDNSICGSDGKIYQNRYM